MTSKSRRMSNLDPPRRPLLLVSVDALNLNFLGPYGCTWLPTPGFDELAAHGVTFDQTIVSNLSLEASLADLANAMPVAQVSFMTDDAATSTWVNQQGFSNVDIIQTETTDPPAASLETTAMFRSVQHALTAFRASQPLPLYWLHLGSLRSTWDAPISMRENLFDEELGDPPVWSRPESTNEPVELDADDRLRWQVCYGAQIQCLDFCVQWIVREANDWPVTPLIVLVGSRGCNLGGHGTILDDSIWSENCHVPCIIADVRRQDCHRLPPLTSLAGIGAWISRVIAGKQELPSEYSEASDPGRVETADRLVIQSSKERALRTDHWFLRLPSRGLPQLFVKPDDRHEINELSSRLPEITQELKKVAEQVYDATNTEPLLKIPEVPSE